MLNRALKFLKRKRNEESENPACYKLVPYNPEVKKRSDQEKEEGLFIRAFRKIKRRILRVCTPNVPAICLCKTPANGSRTQSRYEITPQKTEKKCMESLMPRSYTLNEYINMRESRSFEFKTGGGAYPVQILPEHIRKYGTAFLNCDGGALIAGILDNGQVRGIYCDSRMEERIMSTIYKEVLEFYPPVERSLYSVNFVPVYDRRTRQHLLDRQVVEIIFKSGNPLQLYECGQHKVFLKREGSVEGPLSPLQIKDVVLRKYRCVLNERRELNKTLLSP